MSFFLSSLQQTLDLMIHPLDQIKLCFTFQSLLKLYLLPCFIRREAEAVTQALRPFTQRTSSLMKRKPLLLSVTVLLELMRKSRNIPGSCLCWWTQIYNSDHLKAIGSVVSLSKITFKLEREMQRVQHHEQQGNRSCQLKPYRSSQNVLGKTTMDRRSMGTFQIHTGCLLDQSRVCKQHWAVLFQNLKKLMSRFQKLQCTLSITWLFQKPLRRTSVKSTKCCQGFGTFSNRR